MTALTATLQVLARQEIADEVVAESSWVGPVFFLIVLIVAIVIAIRKLKR